MSYLFQKLSAFFRFNLFHKTGTKLKIFKFLVFPSVCFKIALIIDTAQLLNHLFSHSSSDCIFQVKTKDNIYTNMTGKDILVYLCS